ncbi:cation diffusion facilitator family transporter [Nesterenkonia xinjiangensis]|uniref:Cation diffusion facilitator family transporter n=1 Tax=Nesterenkonia xinjiangensis TaxID=225327 RepID=A0A7Z0KDE1_9MICC|nr:cation diffusion facilitator family transporter [Nesterenkonia xinjiangensis]NYJ79537.1 cation diffusion facilitator family transporter [Nesterenkonia xinjiangensis]
MSSPSMLRPASEGSLPEEQRAALREARRLQWIWLSILLVTVLAMAAVMGSSQAMRTAWIEDLLSVLPPVAFLLAARLAARPPTVRHPFGLHRSLEIGHLVSGVTLGGAGIFLLVDGVTNLLQEERPPLGALDLFGIPVWEGWLMISVALASCVAPVILGRRKRHLAEVLHDKVLRADADMNRADWMTGLATAAGVLGIGVGLWWADAAAAIVISTSITKDGWANTRDAVQDILDARATTFDNAGPHPVIRQAEQMIAAEEWADDVVVIARDQGHVLHLTARVRCPSTAVPVEAIDEIRRRCREMDWRVHDVDITVTRWAGR